MASVTDLDHQVFDEPASEYHQTRKWLIFFSLGLILLLAGFVRFYQLGAYNIGNSYYASTVKSMLTSWHNFFYVAYEPGGSISVDKPPLGFWIEVASAWLFGLNGFSLALPNAVAGFLSVPLLFVLVKRSFGAQAGLIAALVLAVTPVAIATERNNTIDGMLVFTLLLAAWAFLYATESGRLRWLLLGGVLVGLGFNIKMLQAFMPLPAFFLVYFLGTSHPWKKRITHLALTSLVILIISFSWVAAVDLTPATQRPYVGSSTDNTVLELIIGHNGLERLIGGENNRGAVPNSGIAPQMPPTGTDDGRPTFSDDRNGVPPPGMMGSNRTPPGGQMGDNGDGGAFGNEVGSAGIARLFTEPLVEEASWLLPSALLAIPLIYFYSTRRRSLKSSENRGILLWAGWLIPIAVYFSATTGLFHAYYMTMMGPAVAALTGGGFWATRNCLKQNPRFGWLITVVLTATTVFLQVFIISDYTKYTILMITILATWATGIIFLIWKSHEWARWTAIGLLTVSLLSAPIVWSFTVTLDKNPEVNLPNANQQDNMRTGMPGNAINMLNGTASTISADTDATTVMIDYLLANTKPDSYLIAVDNSHLADEYIIETGRPVFTFGGFTGTDQVIDTDGVAAMVKSGKLRFILGGQILAQSHAEINTWVTTNCQVVNISNHSNQTIKMGNNFSGASILYDCAAP